MNHSRTIEILKAAEFSDPQASAIAEAIEKTAEDTLPHYLKPLASKDNVDTLKTEAHHMETSLKQDIAGLGVRMSDLERTLEAIAGKLDSTVTAAIERLEARMNAKMEVMEARLETKIAQSKSEMIRWMFVFWASQFAIMKLFK